MYPLWTTGFDNPKNLQPTSCQHVATTEVLCLFPDLRPNQGALIFGFQTNTPKPQGFVRSNGFNRYKGIRTSWFKIFFEWNSRVGWTRKWRNSKLHIDLIFKLEWNLIRIWMSMNVASIPFVWMYGTYHVFKIAPNWHHFLEVYKMNTAKSSESLINTAMPRSWSPQQVAWNLVKAVSPGESSLVNLP